MTMEHLRHSSTQTNPELHDVMYYKTRALNAEVIYHILCRLINVFKILILLQLLQK